MTRLINTVSRFSKEQKHLFIETLEDLASYKGKYSFAEGIESKNVYWKHIETCISIARCLIETSDDDILESIVKDLENMNCDECLLTVRKLLKIKEK